MHFSFQIPKFKKMKQFGWLFEQHIDIFKKAVRSQIQPHFNCIIIKVDLSCGLFGLEISLFFVCVFFFLLVAHFIMFYFLHRLEQNDHILYEFILISSTGWCACCFHLTCYFVYKGCFSANLIRPRIMALLCVVLFLLFTRWSNSCSMEKRSDEKQF